MKSIRYSIGVVVLLISISASSFAKPWRGLAPLLTTRAQVLELLGSPKLNASDQTEAFDLAHEVVVLRWIRPTCATQTSIPKGEPFRPTDVVLQIIVNPKVPLETLPSEDERNPKTNRDWLSGNIDCIVGGDGHGGCSISYDGFGYSTTDGRITALYCFASGSEAQDWNATQKSCSPSGARLKGRNEKLRRVSSWVARIHE